MRAYAYALSAAMIAAVAYPAFIDPSDDGFPLSTYPMFSRDRGRVSEVLSAVAQGDGGFERPLPPDYVANAEAMQALQTLRKSLRAGPRASRELCRAIARRVRERAEEELAAAQKVALISRRVDSIEYLAGHTRERSRTTHVRCRVPR